VNTFHLSRKPLPQKPFEVMFIKVILRNALNEKEEMQRLIFYGRVVKGIFKKS